ncbi:MAG: hypothetical protein PW788_04750 [Micavibrio sp.]|nr:hypothetical protein [Micavibrio sp.]
MSNLLNSTAVGRKSGEDAGEILQAYVATNPMMALNRTMETTPGAQPKGTAAGDKLIEPR